MNDQTNNVEIQQSPQTKHTPCGQDKEGASLPKKVTITELQEVAFTEVKT